MKIDHVAKQAGVGVETIRLYERKGLLGQPPRTYGGFREYSKEAVAKIRFIKRAKDLGFSLSEIAELLSLETNPKATCADVKQRAMVKIPAKQQRVNDLQTMKRPLGQLVASCSGSGPIDNCPMSQCFGTSTTEGDSQMKTKRQIEIYRAGCQVCEDTVTLVNQLACPSCEVTILDMKNTGVSSRAKLLVIRTIPAVVVDGHLAERCTERGPSERVLRAAEIGTPLASLPFS